MKTACTGAALALALAASAAMAQNVKIKAPGAGTCAAVELVSAGPNSMTAEVAAAKNAAIVMTSDMGTFVGTLIQSIRGKPDMPCPQTAEVTGVHTEMKTVVNEYHRANLAVLNTMEFDGKGKCVAGC